MSQARRLSQKSTARKGTSSSTDSSRECTTGFFLIIKQEGRVIFRKSVPHLPLQMTLEPTTPGQHPSSKLAICPSGERWQWQLVDSAGNMSIPLNGVNSTSHSDSQTMVYSFTPNGVVSITNPPKAESIKTASKPRTAGRTSLRFRANGLSQAGKGTSTGRGYGRTSK